MAHKRSVKGSSQPHFRPDGRWEQKVTVGRDSITGKLKRKTVYGETAEACAKKARLISVDVDKGVYHDPCKLKLHQWCDIWLKSYTVNIKESSRLNYKQIIDTHIKPVMGQIELNKITPHMVQVFITELQEKVSDKTHKLLSAKTVKNIHGTLCKCLSEANRIGYINSNPASRCVLPRIQGKSISPLESDEIIKFNNAIIGEPNEDIFFIAINTGMRLSEIVGLRWSRIDFQNNTITVDAQMLLDRGKDSPSGLSTPKGNRPRQFIAAISVINRLKLVKRKQAEKKIQAGELWKDNDGLVFTNEIGQPVLQRTIEKQFNRIMKKIGSANKGYTFHDLRHTFTVECIKAFIPVKTVSEMLGHKDVAFTLNVYGHVTKDMQLDAATRLENVIQGRVKDA